MWANQEIGTAPLQLDNVVLSNGEHHFQQRNSYISSLMETHEDWQITSRHQSLWCGEARDYSPKTNSWNTKKEEGPSNTPDDRPCGASMIKITRGNVMHWHGRETSSNVWRRKIHIARLGVFPDQQCSVTISVICKNGARSWADTVAPHWYWCRQFTPSAA